jgi:fatty acid desaturase
MTDNMVLLAIESSACKNTQSYECEKYKFSSEIRSQLKNFTGLDNWHGVLALAEDYFVIAASIWVTCQITWLFYPVTLLIIGARQRALATLLHESSHGTLAQNKRLNWFLGTFCSGYLIFQQMGDYKKSHCKGHHRYLGNSVLDPDSKFYYYQGLYDSNLRPKDFLINHIIQPLLLLKVPQYLLYILKHRLFSTKGGSQEKAIMLLYLLVIAIALTALGNLHTLILFWLIPYLTTFQVLGWFIELSEHYPLAGENKIDLHMSRNRLSPWYEAFFTSIHCENFHLIHHLFPSIPFWNMSKVHQILLTDANYAKQHHMSGGIFFASKESFSIVSSWLHYLQERY